MCNRWHILGAGAIGTLWAANLAAAGSSVTLLLRDQHRLDQFRQIEGVLRDGELFPVDAELTADSGSIQQLLITTKSTDTQSAFNSIKNRLTPGAHIVVLQNGMGSQQWVTDQSPDTEVAWASTTDGAWIKSPFSVKHAGKGVTHIGSPTTHLKWLNNLQGGFLNVEIDRDIAASLWRKLAINCAINPLTAVHHCKNGELITTPKLMDEMTALCAEVEAVANALNIPLFEAPLIDQASQVARLTAENYSSMLQDMKHGRTTEIDHITGYLCNLAAELGIKTPINSHYLSKIKKMQNRS